MAEGACESLKTVPPMRGESIRSRAERGSFSVAIGPLSAVAIEYYQANTAAEDIWPRMGADADSLPKFIVTAAAHRLASPFT